MKHTTKIYKSKEQIFHCDPLPVKIIPKRTYPKFSLSSSYSIEKIGVYSTVQMMKKILIL